MALAAKKWFAPERCYMGLKIGILTNYWEIFIGFLGFIQSRKRFENWDLNL